jgi:threonine synthase
LSATPHFARVPQFGFLSGNSTHADRLAAIRACREQYGKTIDTHTADGLKVALEHRTPGITMVVLETAQAVKFAETIREALGEEPSRPAELNGIENLPQRVEIMDADVNAIKAFVRSHC